MAVPRRTALAMMLPGAASWLAGRWARATGESGAAFAQEVRSYGVDVGLVRLSVTARTARGTLVHDLRPEEFHVLEDDVEQEVVRFGHHEAPISVVVLFDKSGSMRDEKLMHAKDGVVNFVRALRAQDEVLVVAFSGVIDVLGDFGLDARTIERAVKRVHAERSTLLYDAVVEGAQAIGGPGRKEKRALLILSDGEDTASDASLAEAVEAVRRAGRPRLRHRHRDGRHRSHGVGRPAVDAPRTARRRGRLTLEANRARGDAEGEDRDVGRDPSLDPPHRRHGGLDLSDRGRGAVQGGVPPRRRGAAQPVPAWIRALGRRIARELAGCQRPDVAARR